MTTTTTDPLAAIDNATLTPFVQRALDAPLASVLSWECQPIYAGMGTGTALYRFSGLASLRGKTTPWSLILKVLDEDSNRADPAHPEWWRREAEAYRSGHLQALPAGLSSPRCFGVVERPDEGCWIWLEEVTDTVGGPWPLAHYGTVARHLGHFNGAYLNGEPPPQWPWLSRNWIRQTVEEAAPVLPLLAAHRDHPLVSRCLKQTGLEKLSSLWVKREYFLSMLDRLPQTLCHMDAFRRNLFTCKHGDDSVRMVAVDWAFTGQGALGTEITCLTAASLAFFEVELEKAQELDDVVFSGYIQGLEEVGWRGDPRKVRLAYRAASLRYAFSVLGPVLYVLMDEESYPRTVQSFGCSMEDLADCWGEVRDWQIETLEEARDLAQILG
jgi:hypothetical protein